MAKMYECRNKACVLGTPDQPGQFTGGITKEQVNLLTGKPVESLQSGEDYGPGFCPNCGAKGKEI
jgi:hypothetical protein